MRLIALVMSIVLYASTALGQGLVFTETWTGFAANVAGDFVNADEQWDKNGGCYLVGDAAGVFVASAIKPYDSFVPSQDPCTPADDTVLVNNVIGDGTERCTNNWNDPSGGACNDPLGCFANTHRAELMPSDNNIRANDGQEHWAGWRIWVPANFPNPIPVSWIVTQAISPPFGGVDWDLRAHTNGMWRHTQRRTVDGQPRNDQVTDFGPIIRGAWHNFVHRWKRQINNTGVSEIWMDNGDGQGYIKYATWTGISSISNQPGTLFKHGLYHGTNIGIGKSGNVNQLMFDDMKIAYGVNQFNTVAPVKDAGACVVAPPAIPFPDPGNILIDDFNRADESPVAGGIWSQGIVTTAGNRIVTNVLVRIAATIGESYVTNPMQANQEAYVTLPNATNHPAGSNFRLPVCLQDTLASAAVDGYNVTHNKQAGVDIIRIEEIVNGAFVQMGADINQELTNNDKLGVRISAGGNVEAFVDVGAGWVSVGTRTDGTPLDCENTRIGVRTGAAEHQVDNYSGGPYISNDNNNLLLNPIIFFD